MTESFWALFVTILLVGVGLASLIQASARGTNTRIDRLEDSMSELRGRMTTLEAELRGRMTTLEAELRERMAKVEGLLEGLREAITRNRAA